MCEVVLPWIDPRLSPNRSRSIHWGTLSRINASARSDAFIMAKEQMRTPFDEKPSSVKIYFTPPDRRVRDKDNMVAAFKSSKDGIADAIMWDDRHWDEQYFVTEPKKPGYVKVVFG